MTKNKQTEMMVGHIETINTILCSFCMAEDQDYNGCTEEDAAEEFYNLGWRVVDNRVSCPLCESYKKHLLKEK